MLMATSPFAAVVDAQDATCHRSALELNTIAPESTKKTILFVTHNV
jgi:hypothetical protein